jgi:hypothetical protein
MADFKLGWLTLLVIHEKVPKITRKPAHESRAVMLIRSWSNKKFHYLHPDQAIANLRF